MTVSAVLAVGLFYDKLVKYRQVGQREARQIENAELLSDLDLWAAAHPDATVEQVLGFALKASTEDIGYTFGKCATDPDGVFRNRRTNCVGYSALFDAAARRLLEKEGLANQVSTTHAIGKLRFLGFDMHRLFSGRAFRDHDFNIVFDKKTGKKHLFDPTLTANLGIRRIAVES